MIKGQSVTYKGELVVLVSCLKEALQSLKDKGISSLQILVNKLQMSFGGLAPQVIIGYPGLIIFFFYPYRFLFNLFNYYIVE